MERKAIEEFYKPPTSGASGRPKRALPTELEGVRELDEEPSGDHALNIEMQQQPVQNVEVLNFEDLMQQEEYDGGQPEEDGQQQPLLNQITEENEELSSPANPASRVRLIKDEDQ